MRRPYKRDVRIGNYLLITLSEGDWVRIDVLGVDKGRGHIGVDAPTNMKCYQKGNNLYISGKLRNIHIRILHITRTKVIFGIWKQKILPVSVGPISFEQVLTSLWENTWAQSCHGRDTLEASDQSDASLTQENIPVEEKRERGKQHKREEQEAFPTEGNKDVQAEPFVSLSQLALEEKSTLLISATKEQMGRLLKLNNNRIR